MYLHWDTVHVYTCIKCVLWHAIRLIVIKVQHGGLIMAVESRSVGGGGGGGRLGVLRILA